VCGVWRVGQYVGKDPQQLIRSSVYFTEGGSGKYVPRSIQIDLEPGTGDNIRAGPMGQVSDPYPSDFEA
jgi:tubulin beta